MYQGLNEGIIKDSKRLENIGKTREDIPEKRFREEEHYKKLPDENNSQKKKNQKLYNEKI